MYEISWRKKIYRHKAENSYRIKGFDFILKKLIKIDKDFKIEKNDRQRLIRAYEVFLQTGRSIKWWQNNSVNEPIIKNCLKILISPPRDELYSFIDKRVDLMVEKGLINEAKNEMLNVVSFDNPSMKAIGIKFLNQYLNKQHILHGIGSVHTDDLTLIKQHGSSDPANVILLSLWIIVIT